MEQEPVLNAHNKEEYPPMHTAEHILNRTMVQMFGCPRSRNAHIERKKSKCEYILEACPTEEQVKAIAQKVNEVIDRHLDVTVNFYLLVVEIILPYRLGSALSVSFDGVFLVFFMYHQKLNEYGAEYGK